MSPAELSAKLEYYCRLRDALRRGEYDTQLLVSREEAVNGLDVRIAEGYAILGKMAASN